MTTPFVWPRPPWPLSLQAPRMPAGEDSFGRAGTAQSREMLQVGATWEEEYTPLILVKAFDPRSFVAQANDVWRSRLRCYVQHNLYKDGARGSIANTGATITVNGANQTGKFININPLAGSMLAGDIVKFPSVNDLVYQLTQFAPLGSTQLKISPPIYTGGSPANGAIIQYDNVLYKALIINLEMPSYVPGEFLSGMRITWREVP